MQILSMKASMEIPALNCRPDEDLVKKCLEGDQDAFRFLYEKYRKPVYATIFRIILDPEEARDLTQETFFSAHRSLAIWDPQRAAFLSWLCRIAANHAIDHWRMRRRRAELPLEGVPESSRTGPVHRHTLEPVERIVEDNERAAQLRRLMGELPQPQSRLVILRYRDGLKLREIAEREGYRIGTVKSVLHRATNAICLRFGRMRTQGHRNSRKDNLKAVLECA